MLARSAIRTDVAYDSAERRVSSTRRAQNGLSDGISPVSCDARMSWLLWGRFLPGACPSQIQAGTDSLQLTPKRTNSMCRNQLTRRQLLKGAAAAVAVPYVITSTALGNAHTPPASERVTLGHIGAGERGGGLLELFQQCKGAQSVAVADAYKERRETYVRVIKGKAYRDFRDILARNDVDAVIVATPSHWHVSMAIAAARAKKDAYVEKPLAVSIEQDLACRKVFTQTGRIFQYGTQQRSESDSRFGCELVRSGRIGKVHTIEVIAPNGGVGGSTQVVPVPPNLDYDMWCGPSPIRPYTADRCHPMGTHWIFDYSIGFLSGWGHTPWTS